MNAVLWPRTPGFVVFGLSLLAGTVVPAGDKVSSYTRLAPVEAKILAAAPAFPGGSCDAENLCKPVDLHSRRRAEYASHGQGVRTFVDFDLGRPAPVAAFRHVQRRTRDTVAEANLVFSDTADFSSVLSIVKIKHVDEPGATTLAAFTPRSARYVRWQATSVLPSRPRNVGGQSIELFAAAEREAAPRSIGIAALSHPIIEQQNTGLVQPLKVTLAYPYSEPSQAVVRATGQAPRTVDLKFGSQTLQYIVPALDAAQPMDIAIEVAGEKVASQRIMLPPARKLIIYVLPHSHTDIGFTTIQTGIEEKQINNLRQGLADARRTAEYPEGARFVWNVEVTWAADLFLKRLPPKDRDELLDAVKRGQVALNGMYLDVLTGLCRPEELIRLFRRGTQLAERTGVPVDSAMISDIPGCTWGAVTAMAQAGIKYFSVGPNHFDRIGTILVDWENRPFWWIGPDGKSRVLVWIPFQGYAMSMHYRGKLSQELVEDLCEALRERDYPYDIAYVRWAGYGDNAAPDSTICEFVKAWNAAHTSPRFVISSTSEAFHALEKRYGDRLPQVRGDWTPYWEDTAGTSAAESAMNRTSSEQLAQAETLWAMLAPQRYPADKFEEAWNNVLLYSEHTWGAYCSVTKPGSAFTVDQWNIKQSYATAANLQSRQLLSQAVQNGAGFQPDEPSATTAPDEKPSCVDVYNTTSWPRTGVVMLPHEVSEKRTGILDAQGRPVPSQRLTSGELAVLVRDLPPFSARRYTVTTEATTQADTKATAAGTVLANGALRVRLDAKTGGIIQLRAKRIDANLVDATRGQAINDYLYLIGDDLAGLQRSGPVKITVGDKGPLVASLRVECDAPGCYRLTREVRLVAGGDYVELLDTVDKRRLETKSHIAKEGKESVHFAFPFNVPDGEIRLDVPLGVIRPEHDQMPSACKNWLSVGRWADVANSDFGVTWVTLDAPLVEVGGITATLLNSQTNPAVWRKTIEPTQKLYSWAMNNHWGVNARAHQEGPVVFRFVLRPHRSRCDDAEATRFAAGFSQPLVAMPGRGPAPCATPWLRVEPSEVIVSGLKPSDDGKAIIVRLLGAGDKTTTARLTWSQPAPKQIWLSDTSERPRHTIVGDVPVLAKGLVTLRADLP